MRPGESNGNTKSMQPAQAAPRALTPSVNGWSAEYLDSEYARFKADPSSVPVDLQAFFQGFDLAMADGASRGVATGPPSDFQRAVDGLIAAYRVRGHLAARSIHLGVPDSAPPELELAYHGLTEADRSRPILAQIKGLSSTPTLAQAIAHLEATYCGTTAVEFMHINNAQERDWFLEKFESVQGRTSLTNDQKLAVLDQLAQSQTFETFVGIKYGPAYKWFSLEGSIPTHSAARADDRSLHDPGRPKRSFLACLIAGSKSTCSTASWARPSSRSSPSSRTTGKPASWTAAATSSTTAATPSPAPCPAASRSAWRWPATPATWNLSTVWSSGAAG